jgi:putative endonuclease
MRTPCVYILASKYNGTLYTGVTSDIVRRVWEHKTGAVDGFTKKYNVKHLVYFELHGTMEAAIVREKQIKLWKRIWKIVLIQRDNPTWRDLYDEILGVVPEMDTCVRRYDDNGPV